MLYQNLIIIKKVILKLSKIHTKGKVQIKKYISQFLGNKQPSTYQLTEPFFDFVAFLSLY